MKNLFLMLLLCVVIPCQAQLETVDVLSIKAEVQPEASSKQISGDVEVQFLMLADASEVSLDAIAMEVVKQPADAVEVIATDETIRFRSNFKKGQRYTVSFAYRATPSQTLYFTGDQIWTQGQGKYTSHWLPSIDAMTDKIEFDLSVKAPHGKEVMANGKLVSKDVMEDGVLWHYNMNHPMASYLVAFAVGDYATTELVSESGVPIILYFRPEDSTKAEATYRHTDKIFNYLEEEIGVGYPWQNYKQAPVRDFLYAGMENTTATIFSEAFVVDPIGFHDRNYVNVNAHELAHQWFGNLVTETSGKHHWLQEGFATYYALLAEREIFGDDYFYWKLYNSAEQLKNISDSGKGQRLLDPNASSLTFYEKGAWALHILKERIGTQAFQEAIKTYLQRHAYENVRTEDFLDAVRQHTDKDISAWKEDWLEQTAFQSEEAYQSLMKSPFMRSYFEVAALRGVPLEDKKTQLEAALIFPNDFIGQEAIYQLASEPIEQTLPLYKKGFASNNLYVRQAIASSLTTVPSELQTQYETLLQDKSYVTQELAVYTLWAQFPEKRHAYLNQMEGVIGFQDKNIRQLWLALAIATPTFRPEQTESYVSELRSYTANTYSFEIRQKAFQYCNELQLYNERVIENLINACVHPNWRFRSYARDLLDEVLKNPGTKEALQKSKHNFPKRQQAYLERVLK